MRGDDSQSGDRRQQTLDDVLGQFTNPSTDTESNSRDDEQRAHVKSKGSDHGERCATRQEPNRDTEENGTEATDLISGDTYELLHPRQQIIHEQNVQALYRWMCEYGKNPANRDGLATGTAENYLRRLDSIWRWVWQRASRILLKISQEWADKWCVAIDADDVRKANGGSYSESHKRKSNDALQKYHLWLAHQREGERWTPPISYSDGGHRQPDEFTVDERRRLREAALEYATIPAYGDCTPEQRTQLKSYIAQRLGKPKNDIRPADWEQINTSWERPSLIWTALDAALRPIEVGASTVEWIRLDKQSLYVPKTQSAKSRDNWEVALQQQTVQILRRWLEEREHRTRYSGTDAIWLTREGNRWSSDSLNYLLRRLCDVADIQKDNRWIVWYSIRHSVGEHMASEGGIEQAKEQLRHKSIDSTLQYTHPSLHDRRSTLNKMG